MAKSTKQGKGRIVFLDYLRIFAFVSVLIGHKFYAYAEAFVNNNAMHATPRLFISLLLPFFYEGGAGVVVFFLISGYIITYVLQTEQPKAFFIKRIFRIYPLYMTAVLLETYTTWFFNRTIPSFSILIKQLLLIGDFFRTPYTLGGVEWTLRIEILFYLFMGLAQYFGFFHKKKRFFTTLVVLVILYLGWLSPIPSSSIWSKGYITIYAPFLLLGTFFYLKETNQISSWVLFGGIVLVLSQYYYLITMQQPRWRHTHFTTLSVFLFFFAWYYRDLFNSYPIILYGSNLTYSVYLFHNWIWDPIKIALARFSIAVLHPDIQALVVLILFCTLMFKVIEKTGIKLGRITIKKLAL